MSLFEDMESVTLKNSREELEGSCFLDEALNIKQMFKNYKDKKEAAKLEIEKTKAEHDKISRFTYDMEQSMTGNVNGSAIIKAIKEYETGNKHFTLVRLSYAINFLGMAREEDVEKAKALVKSEIKRARNAGVEKSAILKELRLCKAASSKHGKFVNDLMDNIGNLSESGVTEMKLELPGDGVKETTSEKQYVKVPMKQTADYEAVQGKEVKLEIPGDGVKETTSEKQYVKVPEKQSVDMESKLEESVDSLLEDVYYAEDLLAEALEMVSLSEGKDPVKEKAKLEKQIAKTERALKIAKMAREELDNMTKGGLNVSFAQRGWGAGWGTGMGNNSTARSTARGKVRADEKIEKIEAKLAELKQKLADLGADQVGGSVQMTDLESKLEESVYNILDDVEDVEELLDEAMELLSLNEGKVERAEKKVAKAERKLKLAKMARKELEKGQGGDRRLSVDMQGPFTGLGTGMGRNSKARSIARGKMRADDRIEKAERKLEKAKNKAEQVKKEQGVVKESMNFSVEEENLFLIELEESLDFFMEDMDDIDELIDEAEDLLVEGKNPEKALQKAERKLEKAKKEREKMNDEKYKRRYVTRAANGSYAPYGSGANFAMRGAAIARARANADSYLEKDKARQDKRIEKLEAKIKDLKSEGYDYLEETEINDLLVESIELSEEIDNLLEETEDLLFEAKDPQKAVKKAERKLKLAKMAREELEKGQGGDRRLSVDMQGPFTGLGTGMGRNSKARSIARGKMRADNRIERAERRLEKAKAKAAMREAMELTLPGGGVKETTSGQNVYGKVGNQQMVDAPEPKKDQAPETLIKVGKVQPKEVEDMVEDMDEEEELMDESTVIEYFDEIKLSESQVRVFSQYGKYIISESDFEACCAYYDGETEETVLNAIAEANNIEPSEIHIMLAEGRCAGKKKVKKAMNKKGSADGDAERKRIEAKIRRLKDQLKDTAPSSATAKKLQAQIKKLKASLK